jgi:predicted nucleotidyltransferase
MIKYGDIEYFALLELNDRLKDRMLNRLDLVNIDRLRNEVEMKIMAIHEAEKKRKENDNKKS